MVYINIKIATKIEILQILFQCWLGACLTTRNFIQTCFRNFPVKHECSFTVQQLDCTRLYSWWRAKVWLHTALDPVIMFFWHGTKGGYYCRLTSMVISITIIHSKRKACFSLKWFLIKSVNSVQCWSFSFTTCNNRNKRVYYLSKALDIWYLYMIAAEHIPIYI